MEKLNGQNILEFISKQNQQKNIHNKQVARAKGRVYLMGKSHIILQPLKAKIKMTADQREK